MSKKKQSLLAGKISSKKESEIPKVIEKLGLKNKIFTLDTLHCQKNTTKKIETNNDYVIGVKGNQKKLLETIKKITKNKSVNRSIIKEKNRGRSETRKVETYENMEGINKKKWLGIKGIIYVNGVTKFKKKMKSFKNKRRSIFYI